MYKNNSRESDTDECSSSTSESSDQDNLHCNSSVLCIDSGSDVLLTGIPIPNKTRFAGNRPTHHISKSWNDTERGSREQITPFSRTPDFNDLNLNSNLNPFNKKRKFKPYDAIGKCKSAGIIPYTIYNGETLFLFQKINNPVKKKDGGWNDFGGKKINSIETTIETASREFSEETSCLFYLKEFQDNESCRLYDLLKDNKMLEYDDHVIISLKDLIPKSQHFFSDRIAEFVLPIFVSSKETYISYFVKVNYIPANDLPRAEDIHIPYEERYTRICKWFNINDLMMLNEKDFHRRLQITKIQQRIYNYYQKGLFT